MGTLIGWVHTISIWIVILPSLIGLFYFKKLGNSSKIIWGMSLLAVIPQMISIMPYFKGKRYIYYNLYTIPEILFSFIFLWLLMDKKRPSNHLIKLFLPIFFGVFIWLLFREDITKRFFFECVAICNLMVVFGVLNIIYHAIQSNSIIIKKNQPENYFITGLFFYAPLTVIIYSLWNFLQSHPDSAVQKLNIIHAIANTTMYALFACGIAMDAKAGNFKNKHLLNPIKIA